MEGTASVTASQTLSRGIRILEALAEAGTPLSIDELAARLGVHRSIAYRLLRTLEDHRLVGRDGDGRMVLGPRLAALASGVAPDLQAAARPELAAVADELGMSCFLAVLDGDDCITLVSVEPRRVAASVVQRPGARHPAVSGAPGRALLALLPASGWSGPVADEIASVVRDGFATSHDEVIPGVGSVAVPLQLPGQRPAALAVVRPGPVPAPESVAFRLVQAAAAIRAALAG